MVSFKVFKAREKYTSKANTLVEQQKEYQLNFFEWAAINNKIIWKSGETSGTAVANLYDIPPGKFLYITSAWITGSGGGNTNFSGSEEPRSICYLQSLANVNNTITQTFPIPIKISKGYIALVSAGGVGLNVKAGFVGFLMDF